MKVGIFTQYIQADSIEELAVRVKGFDLSSVVLDTFPGMDMDVENPDPLMCQRIKNAFDEAGVEIAAVGGYVNFIHPDPEERAEAGRRFSGMIKLCQALGVKLLCSEAGTYHPSWGWDSANLTDSVFALTVDTIRPYVEEARAHGVNVCLEPYVQSVGFSAERMAELVKALDPEAVKVVFDPAGLLTRATLETQVQNGVIRHAFEVLQPYIGIVHVQDCRPTEEWNDHFNWLGAGQGLINYEVFMDVLAAYPYEGPFILEFIREEDIPASLAYVRNHWEQANSRTSGS